MKKRLIAALMALCSIASIPAATVSAVRSPDEFYSSSWREYYYGFIVQTDGTELTQEMIPFEDDYNFLALYTWENFCGTDEWTYSSDAFTPDSNTYFIRLRSYYPDDVSFYARQLMLELDCVEDSYHVSYTLYFDGQMMFMYPAQFFVSLVNEDVLDEVKSIPELEGFTFSYTGNIESEHHYLCGIAGEDSWLYQDMLAYVEERYTGVGETGADYASKLQLQYEFFAEYSEMLENNYSEYFTLVEPAAYSVETLDSSVKEVSAVTSVWSTAGDHNADGETNANDAADLLVQAAQDGVAEASETTVSPDSDVNLDGAADSTDAAYILQYSALKGSGADADWVEILK